MAQSYLPASIQIATPDPMPWGWNPAATFMRAYYDQKNEQRVQEKMAMEQELYRILLPQKAAEAEFNLKKLAYDSELLTDAFKTQTAELEERRRILRSGGTGTSGASSNVAGNVGSSNQAGVYQSRFGFGSKLTPPAASAPQAVQPTTRKVGSGLMPKQP